MSRHSELRLVLLAVAVLASVVALVTSAVIGGASIDQHDTSAPRSAASACQPVRLAYPATGSSDLAQNFGDLYLPRADHPGRAGMVVLVHGGGWQAKLGGLQGLAPVARDLAQRGLAVYNIEYRRVGSGGGWPTTLLDVRDATAYAAVLQSRNPQLRGPLIVVGHSAGGHLAVWAAEHQRTVHAPLAISIAGPLDLEYAATHGDHNIAKLLGGSPTDLPARYALADPSRTVPPRGRVFLVQGTHDRVVPLAVARHYLSDISAGAASAPRMITIGGATHTSLVTPGRLGYTTVITAILSEAAGIRATQSSCASCAEAQTRCATVPVTP